MDLPDNNILINAIRPDAKHHRIAKDWLEDSLNSGRSIRLFPTVEVGFLRVVTNPRVFPSPTPFAEAWDFLRVLCSSPGVEVSAWTPEARLRWGSLCAELGLVGNDCNDAILAALAMEKGLRLVTFDKGFKRFPGLDLLLVDA